MAIYGLSDGNQIPEFLAAITDNANLTLNDSSTDSCTFTHTGLGLTFEFYNLSSGWPKITVGDGYTSGSIPNNPVILSPNDTEPLGVAELIVGADYMIYHFHEGGGIVYGTLICGKLANGDVACLAFHYALDSGGSSGYLLSTGGVVKPVAPEKFGVNITMATTGNYLQIPLYVCGPSGAVVENLDGTPSHLLDFYLLFKSMADQPTHIEVSVTNIIINSKYNAADAKEIVILGEGLYQ